jgi:ribosomal protein L37AE/L43A
VADGEAKSSYGALDGDAQSCACEPSNIIGISDGDSIGYWQCRTCGHEWERGGYFAKLARRNIDQMRKRDQK